MANEIKIDVVLDDGSVKSTLLKIENAGEETGQKLSESIDAGLGGSSESIDKLTQSIDNLNESLNSTAVAQESVLDQSGNIAEIFQASTAAAGFLFLNLEKIIFVLKRAGIISDEFGDSIINLKKTFLEFLSDVSKGTFEKLIGSFKRLISSSEFLKRLVIDLAFPIGLLASQFGLLDNVLLAIIGGMDVFRGALLGVIPVLLVMKNEIVNLGRLAGGIGSFFARSTKNIFGLTFALAGVGSGLLALGSAFERSNSEILRVAAVVAKFTGILLVSLSAAISVIIIAVGKLAFQIGTKLVGAFDKASKQFVKTERDLIIFTKTISAYNMAADGAVGTSEEWTKSVARLSNELNLSETSLRKAAAEIAAVGSRLGLQQTQLEQLLQVTAEYAKLTGKDVFQASVAFVGALNGNAQAVQAYGIKLNEASNQTFALKRGIASNFRTLSDGSKVQIRFNNLLKQYKDVAGVAASASDSLSEQQAKMAVNQEKFNAALGRGASIIEHNNVIVFAFNRILNNLNGTVLEVSGFLGALGARILQIGGLFLEWSFKIFAVVKVFKLLDIFLKSDFAASNLARSIPIFNQSLDSVIATLTKTELKVRNVQDLLKAGRLAGVQGFKTLSRVIFGVEAASLTTGKALKGLFTNAVKGFAKLLPIINAIVRAIGPLALKLTLVVGVFLLVKKAIEQVERETAAFSTLWAILVDEFNDSEGVFFAISEFFSGTFLTAMKDLAKRGIAVVGLAIGGLLRLVTTLIASNPLGAFSEKSVAAAQKLDAVLNKTNQNFVATIFGMGVEYKNLASTINGTVITPKVNLEELQRLKDELSNVGKTPLDLITEQLTARTALLDQAFAAGQLKQAEHQSLSLTALQDFNTKAAAIAKASSAAFANTIQGGITNAFAGVGAAFAKGENAFDAFAKSILNSLGDMAIQYGVLTLGIGEAATFLAAALSNPYTGPLAIVAGLALIALGGALKGFASNIQSGGADAVSGDNAAQLQPAGGIAEPALQETATEVNISVEGAIVDARGTAEAISELLTDVSRSNGIVVNT